jgi:hypothetical protein
MCHTTYQRRTDPRQAQTLSEISAESGYLFRIKIPGECAASSVYAEPDRCFSSNGTHGFLTRSIISVLGTLDRALGTYLILTQASVLFSPDTDAWVL